MGSAQPARGRPFQAQVGGPSAGLLGANLRLFDTPRRQLPLKARKKYLGELLVMKDHAREGVAETRGGFAQEFVT